MWKCAYANEPARHTHLEKNFNITFYFPTRQPNLTYRNHSLGYDLTLSTMVEICTTNHTLMSRVQIQAKSVYDKASIFIAVLVIYRCSLGTMGAPYSGWVWTCCGLTVAGACTKHWPCYWSQTSLLLTKNSKKKFLS